MDSLYVKILQNLIEKSREQFTFGMPNEILYAALASTASAMVVFAISSLYKTRNYRIKKIMDRKDLELFIYNLLNELAELAKKQSSYFSEATEQLSASRVQDILFNSINSSLIDAFLQLESQSVFSSLCLNKRGDMQIKSRDVVNIYSGLGIMKASIKEFENKKYDFFPLYDKYQNDCNDVARKIEIFDDQMHLFTAKILKGIPFDREEHEFYLQIDLIFAKWQKLPNATDPYVSAPIFEEINAECKKHKIKISTDLMRVSQDGITAYHNLKNLSNLHSDGARKAADTLLKIHDNFKEINKRFREIKYIRPFWKYKN
jgi:hypothetical protein